VSKTQRNVNIGSGRKFETNFAFRASYSRRCLRYPLDRKWVGLQSRWRCEGEEKILCPCLESNPDCANHGRFVILDHTV